MRVAVVGGGVIGLATAYSLVRQGHSVELIERRDDVGLETSFANGGQLSYRYVSPLADAGVPLQALGWMLRGQTAPLRFSPRASLRQWRWCLRFRRPAGARSTAATPLICCAWPCTANRFCAAGARRTDWTVSPGAPTANW